MENVKILNSQDVPVFLEELAYGSNIIQYFDQNTRVELLKKIEVLNLILGDGAIEEKDSIDYPNCFNILFRIRNESTPVLLNDEYHMKDMAIEAQKEQKRRYLKIDERLHKYAVKLAFSLGIKFTSDSAGTFFNGEAKSKSVYRQICEAFRRGDAKIVFDAHDYSSQTIRVYVSNLSTETGAKIKCSVKNGLITVLFRNFDSLNTFKEQVSDLFDKCAEEFGITETLSAMLQVGSDKSGTGQLPKKLNSDKLSPVVIDNDGQTRIPVPGIDQEEEEEDIF